MVLGRREGCVEAMRSKARRPGGPARGPGPRPFGRQSPGVCPAGGRSRSSHTLCQPLRSKSHASSSAQRPPQMAVVPSGGKNDFFCGVEGVIFGA